MIPPKPCKLPVRKQKELDFQHMQLNINPQNSLNPRKKINKFHQYIFLQKLEAGLQNSGDTSWIHTRCLCSFTITSNAQASLM